MCSEGHVHSISAENKIDFYQVRVDLNGKTYYWNFYLNYGTDEYDSSIIYSEGIKIKGFTHPIQVSPDNIKEKLKTILTFL